MSSSNEQRSQAESIFNLINQTDPNSLALKLAQLRSLSTILFRKQLTRDDSYIWPCFSAATQSTFKSVLLTVIQNENIKSIIKKLCVVINFIQCLNNSTDRDRFQDLLPAMMRTLTEALNSSQETTAQEALEILIELAGTEPRFLRRQLVDIVGSMLQIAETQSLEEGTRHLAIQFIITLAEARERAPGMMRKLSQFISRMFTILMNMLLDIEDVPEWHSAVAEIEDAGESNNYSVAQESLERLAIAFRGNTIVPIAFDQLPAYLAAPEWQKNHSALIALKSQRVAQR